MQTGSNLQANNGPTTVDNGPTTVNNGLHRPTPEGVTASCHATGNLGNRDVQKPNECLSEIWYTICQQNPSNRQYLLLTLSSPLTLLSQIFFQIRLLSLLLPISSPPQRQPISWASWTTLVNSIIGNLTAPATILSLKTHCHRFHTTTPPPHP